VARKAPGRRIPRGVKKRVKNLLKGSEFPNQLEGTTHCPTRLYFRKRHGSGYKDARAKKNKERDGTDVESDGGKTLKTFCRRFVRSVMRGGKKTGGTVEAKKDL